MKKRLLGGLFWLQSENRKSYFSYYIRKQLENRWIIFDACVLKIFFEQLASYFFPFWDFWTNTDTNLNTINFSKHFSISWEWWLTTFFQLLLITEIRAFTVWHFENKCSLHFYITIKSIYLCNNIDRTTI